MLASRAWRRASENPGRYPWGGDRAEARVTGGRTAGPAAVRAAIACTKARRPCLDRRRRHLAGRQRRPRHRRARGAAIRGTIRSWVRPQTGTRRAWRRAASWMTGEFSHNGGGRIAAVGSRGMRCPVLRRSPCGEQAWGKPWPVPGGRGPVAVRGATKAWPGDS